MIEAAVETEANAAAAAQPSADLQTARQPESLQTAHQLPLLSPKARAVGIADLVTKV